MTATDTAAQMRDDRVLPLTRQVSLHLANVLVLAFVILYFFPDRTGQLWAWPIHPEMTPLLMGAGYIAGAYFLYRVYLASRWHTVSLGLWPISVFAAFMSVATFIHWDRFTHGHPIFWLWLGLYVITPFLVPIVWFRNRRTDPGVRSNETMLAWPLRAAFAIFGVLELASVAAAFIRPGLVTPIWPWKLSPLTARIVVGWFSLTGVFGLTIAIDGRWNAIRLPLEAALIGVALIALGAWRAWGDFDPANPATWLFLGFLAAIFLVFAVLLLIMERARASVASGARHSPS